ncbi:MAG: LysR family transcriptional regulator, partial [Oscillospiraceae bacterium]|nr:LysR family transcriptional regulator [Oscillospiraceae bacterium]
METISLYYFSEVAKDLHITETANRLHITQQTLSNHILRLERDFGAQLLNRKPNVSLTYAGEFVLAFAETVLKEQT